jgi:TATA-binding protein-associated factor Taf7
MLRIRLQPPAAKTAEQPALARPAPEKVVPIVLNVSRAQSAAAKPAAVPAAPTGPEQHTYEEHTVLRLPEDLAKALLDDGAASIAVDTGTNAESSRLSVDWESERVARVVVRADALGEVVLKGVLLDLPTVVETYRGCDVAAVESSA